MRIFLHKLKSRGFQLKANWTVSTIFMIISVVLVNTIFASIPSVFGIENMKVDLTPNKLYTVSSLSKTLLAGLTRDVHIYAMFDEVKNRTEDRYKEILYILDQYKNYDKINISYVDIDKNPAVAKELDPDNIRKIAKNDIIVVSGKKIQKIVFTDLFENEFDTQTRKTYDVASAVERTLTSAVNYVTSDKDYVVYFVTGHGENPIKDFSVLNEVFVNNGFLTDSLNLMNLEKVPENAELLIFANPKEDLRKAEADVLKSYLKNGGKAYFMISSSPVELNNFDVVFNMYNLQISYNKIEETAEFTNPKNSDEIIVRLDDDELNIPLGINEFKTVFSKARGITQLISKNSAIEIRSLVKTSDGAKSISTDLSKTQNLKGSFTLAYAAQMYEADNTSSKIVVAGSGMFTSDEYINSYSGTGLQFFMNTVMWMVDKKGIVPIDSKSYETPTLNINVKQAGIIAVCLGIIFPSIIFLTGVLIWLKRRHI